MSRLEGGEPYRVMINVLIGSSDYGPDDERELWFPIRLVLMDELPGPGDVLSAPIPWAAQYFVESVAQGDGLLTDSYIDGDPDEVRMIWYDVDVHAGFCPPGGHPGAPRRWVRYSQQGWP